MSGNLRRQRRGPGRGRAFAGPDVGSAKAFVLSGSEAFQLRIAAGHGLLVDLLEERDAPAAAGAGAAAFRELARDFGPPLAHEVDELSPRHVKAVTNLGIEIHQWFARRGKDAEGCRFLFMIPESAVGSTSC